ncbi:hypothetical protein KA012_04550 [Candidatus Woesebacteria bacterium]|nr:hypothetical protein [Candidatus Woesebacteria bacterium]
MSLYSNEVDPTKPERAIRGSDVGEVRRQELASRVEKFLRTSNLDLVVETLIYLLFHPDHPSHRAFERRTFLTVKAVEHTYLVDILSNYFKTPGGQEMIQSYISRSPGEALQHPVLEAIIKLFKPLQVGSLNTDSNTYEIDRLLIERSITNFTSIRLPELIGEVSVPKHVSLK